MRYALYWYVYDRQGYVIREDLVCARLVEQKEEESLQDAVCFSFADYVSNPLEWTPDGWIVQGIDYPEGVIREY